MASRNALLGLVIFGAVACSASVPPPAKPTALPAANLQSLDAAPQDLGAALGGRPALLSFWATWCDACQKEMPDLSKLDEWARAHGGVVMGVAVGEPVAKVRAFAGDHRLPYPILVDEDFHLADTLGEKRVPATLVVDRTGRIVHAGGSLDAKSEAAFRALF